MPPRSFLTAGRWVLALLACVASFASRPAQADSSTGSQRDAAQAYFAALAADDAQALSYSIHPDELEALRQRLLGLMRTEAAKNDNTIRGRLFGAATPLSDLERMTTLSFFVAVARRVTLSGREFGDVSWVGLLKDGSSRVWLVGRLKPVKDRGSVEVVQLVGLIPYGKDWKAIIPLEMQAQLDDLIAGRSVASAAAANGGPAAGAGAPAATTNPPAPKEIATLLSTAEQSLIAGKCGDYYRDSLSPNFRRLMPPKALDTLISACENSLGARESLISALRIVSTLNPRLEEQGTRAVYDVANQGLPFDRYVLEKIKDRWYIAE